MTTMTTDAADMLTPEVDLEPGVARPSFLRRLTAPRPSMPDAVRGHPALNIHYLLATGTLKLWTQD